MKNFDKLISHQIKKIEGWALSHIVGLFIFNIALVWILLLHSAGYFAPFFPLTINIIMLISIILSILLLEANSKTLFILAIAFWMLSAFLRIVGVNIWAERSSVYFYEALCVAVTLFIIEGIKK